MHVAWYRARRGYGYRCISTYNSVQLFSTGQISATFRRFLMMLRLRCESETDRNVLECFCFSICRKKHLILKASWCPNEGHGPEPALEPSYHRDVHLVQTTCSSSRLRGCVQERDEQTLFLRKFGVRCWRSSTVIFTSDQASQTDHGVWFSSSWTVVREKRTHDHLLAPGPTGAAHSAVVWHRKEWNRRFNRSLRLRTHYTTGELEHYPLPRHFVIRPSVHLIFLFLSLLHTELFREKTKASSKWILNLYPHC